MTIFSTKQREFPRLGASTKYQRIEGYSHEMRIFVNSDCNHKCSFPEGQTWCHSREDMVGSGRKMDSETWQHLLEGLERWNKHSLKIAGMEPPLHHELTDLISTTQSFNMTDVSMTTNGSHLGSILRDLVDAGLNRMPVSLHTLNQDLYKQSGESHTDVISPESSRIGRIPFLI